MTNLEQMLKLYTKKDLWNRIQEKQAIINDLREQLKNAIVPKFKINEDVYIIWHGMIIDVEIKAIGENEYYVDTCHFDLADGYGGIFVDENEIFKTHEEAEQNLNELTHQHEDKGGD